MPQTPHVERHFTAGEVVRDVVIGMSDGLTVPFALAAGLSGATESAALVVTAGLAEVAAGAIAMGLGGYLAARNDAEHYASERRREEMEVAEKEPVETAETIDVFEAYGLTATECAPIVQALRRDPQRWVDFMMRFELGLQRPDPARARTSAATIAGAYAVGGLVPLAPYFGASHASAALPASIALTLCALAAFGYAKGAFIGASAWRSAVQTTLIGGIAATAAFAIARLFA